MLSIKKYISIIIFSICLASILSSCEKEIDFDLHRVDPKIVIEGIVKQDQLAKVRVSQTLDFDDNSGYPFLEGAIVKISDDAGNSETLKQDITGWYVAENIAGVIGREYYMSVIYEDKEYTSTSQMPPRVPLDSLTIYKMPVMDWGVPMIHFKDPKGAVNQYYRALLFINGKQHPDVQEFALNTKLMDGSAIHQWMPVFTHDEDNDPIEQGDVLTIEFQCIDKGAYDFFFTLMQGDQYNPTTNIIGGSLGYFSACTAEQMVIIAEWKK